MKEVLEKAEQLAASIIDSEEFIAMRLAEQAVTRDAQATRLISAFIERRQKVENLLTENNLDQGELALAGERCVEAAALWGVRGVVAVKAMEG